MMGSLTALGYLLAFFCVAVNSNRPDYCSLPAVTGPCRAAFKRFYFNFDTGSCEQFVYGGCRGNANNFPTISACKAACSCTLSLDTGNSSTGERICRRSDSRGKFYYDTSSGTCKSFLFTGCGGNSNRFRSTNTCEEACATSKCYLPPETGMCKAYFKKFYYDRVARECRSFVWGGCSGNANNFSSKRACDAACTSSIASTDRFYSDPSPSSTTVAPTVLSSNLEPDPGTVPADSQVGAETIDTTDSGAVAVPAEGLNPDCLLPKVIGPCKAAFPKYYYNSLTKACEWFLFGGCRGNANNFGTLEDCQSRCDVTPGGGFPTSEPVLSFDSQIGIETTDKTNTEAAQVLNPDCLLPKVIGPCKAAFPKYYYNSLSKACERFLYGGCRGNANNFGTLEDCQNHCSVITSSLRSNPDPVLSVAPVGSQIGIETIDTTNTEASEGLNPDCLLPKEVGPCGAAFRKFYYSKSNKACERFIYGGCHGNANNFRTQEACETRCGLTSGGNSSTRQSWWKYWFN